MAYPTSPIPPLGVFVFAAALLAVPARASSAVAIPGQSVTFSVTAAGTAPFSYRWYKNGTLITNAISQSYLISSVKSADAGTYTVVVANAKGSAVSDSAILAIAATTKTGAGRAAASPAAAGPSAAPAAATPSAGGAPSLAAAAAGAAPAAAGAGSASPAAGGLLGGSAETYALWRRLAPGVPDPGDWRAISVTVGSDGETQIVWQNTVTGAAELWIMDGATLLQVIPLADLPAEPASTP